MEIFKKDIHKHLKNVSSHIIQHHKKYFRGIWWSLFSFMTIKMIAIVGIAWLLPMVNETFARPADGVKANNDYYETAISTTLNLNASAGVLINDSNTRGWTTISAFLDSCYEWYRWYFNGTSAYTGWSCRDTTSCVR